MSIKLIGLIRLDVLFNILSSDARVKICGLHYTDAARVSLVFKLFYKYKLIVRLNLKFCFIENVVSLKFLRAGNVVFGAGIACFCHSLVTSLVILL